MSRMTRRSLLVGAGSTLLLGGCDPLTESATVKRVLASAEGLTRVSQRLFTNRTALAREFDASMLSPVFKANGTTAPSGAEYQALANAGFADWRLKIDGLVARPMTLSLADLRALPSRTQITRHDCVEGWSAIGEWTGPQLGPLLKTAGLKPDARYLVFYCADDMEASLDGSGRYYESIDLIDAFHPQTILAHTMNGQALAVPYGAPIRLRVERQLGYKHAKYVMRIEAVASFDAIAGGRGGYWEDRGYEWYAGI